MATRSVGQYIDDLAERVADEEAPDAPRLIGDGIGDLEARRDRAGIDLVNVIHLDGGTGVPDPPSLMTLTCGLACGSSEAKVNIQPKSMASFSPSSSS